MNTSKRVLIIVLLAAGAMPTLWAKQLTTEQLMRIINVATQRKNGIESPKTKKLKETLRQNMAVEFNEQFVSLIQNIKDLIYRVNRVGQAQEDNKEFNRALYQKINNPFFNTMLIMINKNNPQPAEQKSFFDGFEETYKILINSFWKDIQEINRLNLPSNLTKQQTIVIRDTITMLINIWDWLVEIDKLSEKISADSPIIKNNQDLSAKTRTILAYTLPEENFANASKSALNNITNILTSLQNNKILIAQKIRIGKIPSGFLLYAQ